MLLVAGGEAGGLPVVAPVGNRVFAGELFAVRNLTAEMVERDVDFAVESGELARYLPI